MPNFYRDNDDILFQFKHLDLDRIIELKEDNFSNKDNSDFAPRSVADARDSYDRIMEVVGDISGNFVAPHAAEVDEEGAKFEDGEVQYAKATEEGLKLCRQADLMGFTLPRRYGGLNCPMTAYSMAIEIISRADAAFMNIYGLQCDNADTLYKFGDEEQRKKYLPRFCSGEDTSAMVLTEPDAGSDLQAVMLKAHQDKDGQWRLNGVKRFITNGCGNLHLVLARSEEGTHDGRGLSMFMYVRDETMRIRRIENKLGIHGSPTCEMQYNNSPCELVGSRKMGLIKYVMSLMNEARVGISAQGLGIAEAAYREAKKYAEERVQFKKPIKDFMAVSEMLANMKTKIEAGRTLLYETTRIVDLKDCLEEHVKEHPEKAKELKADMKKYTALAALLTPICKAWNTEISNEVSYDGIQIHGGTGYMKEFNAERHYRDARITNIYEGTTQLQVVAAIGGIVKGVCANLLDEYEAAFDYSSVEQSHKKVLDIVEEFKKAVAFVKEKGDNDFQDYHARRLTEIATKAIIGYLMLRDATRSERKKDVLKYFLEFAVPEVKMKAGIILSDTSSLLEKKEAIINGKN